MSPDTPCLLVAVSLPERVTTRAQADGVALDRPVEGLAVAAGHVLDGQGVQALGVEQDPVHLEDGGTDGRQMREGG